MAIKRAAAHPDDPASAPPTDAANAEPDPQAAQAAVTAAPPPMPLIGTACDRDTPGWLMGIGKAPETKSEHDSRLGAAAGKFNDIGFLFGTLEARDNWPAAPVAAAPGLNPGAAPVGGP